MAVEPVDKYRVVGRRGIDQCRRRQGVRLPVLVIPLSAQYPSALRQFCGKIPDPLYKFLGRFSVSQVN